MCARMRACVLYAHVRELLCTLVHMRRLKSGVLPCQLSTLAPYSVVPPCTWSEAGRQQAPVILLPLPLTPWGYR